MDTICDDTQLWSAFLVHPFADVDINVADAMPEVPTVVVLCQCLDDVLDSTLVCQQFGFHFIFLSCHEAYRGYKTGDPRNDVISCTTFSSHHQQVSQHTNEH